ncbi:F0F1 ATP synthase subunit epsilon [Niabella sp. W65]|nr:F0F1 ATP synthase subunit epsilon [Niabella sp. W65]MCH7362424.1 F0F1 ATP synthase subunit epsilon [Niabella sp. W65]
MKLDILTPEGSIFSGEAYGVQMPGVTGSFEVLNRHAPMIAALGKAS